MSVDTSAVTSKYPKWERFKNIIDSDLPMLVQHMAIKSTAFFMENIQNFDIMVKNLQRTLPKANELMLETEMSLLSFGEYGYLAKSYSDEEFTTFFTLYN